jgi:SAM-dependent methyltransferase
VSGSSTTHTWSDQAYWQGRFTVGDTPWELSAPSTVLIEALQEVEARGVSLKSTKVLSPGCGTASDAMELARRGAHVVAVDWSTLALNGARRKYAALSSELSGTIDFRQGDFFAISPESVDIVCEHTFFCAIDPGMRQRYIDAIARWVKPEGFLIGNFFILDSSEAQALPGLSLTKEGQGPPFACTREALEHLTKPHFEPIVMRPANNPEPSRRPGMEWVCIFRKRA